MDSTSLKYLKYSMVFFNLLFFLCGAATLGVGIWAAVGAQSFRDILTNNPIVFDGVYIIIAIGGVLTLIGLLGCCGAMMENRCLLGTYFVLVLLIFIAEVVAAVLIAVYYPQVEQLVLDTVGKYGDGTVRGTVIKQAWDTIQATLGCCGFTRYTEWRNNADWEARFGPDLVPGSCCKRATLSLDGTITDETRCKQGNEEFLNTNGCSTIFHNYIWAAAGVGIGILLFELLGMIFACILYRAIGRVSPSHA